MTTEGDARRERETVARIMRFAIKRLSQVEVATRASKRGPSAGHSNQHELNAGVLRQELGLPSDVTGSLRLLFYFADETEPIAEEATYRLYNARREKTHRSAEYRLYYHTNRVSELAHAGDLLVIFRPDPNASGLTAVIARGNTRAERALLQALKIDPDSALARFAARDNPRIGRRELEELGQLDLLRHAQQPVSDNPFLASVHTTGRMPKPEELAQAARAAVVGQWGDLPPDAFLEKTTDEESRLYFGVEKIVHERRLTQMLESGPQLHSVLNFAMSIFQSRKSRRGLSLQSHFGALLAREDIPFTPQCPTEAGETPDFVIPGQAAYSDPEFPDRWLRMVACKSAVRERWRQILKEAQRIPEKFLLTLDPALSGDLLSNMADERLRCFVPANVKSKSYPGIGSVETVGDLVSRLHAVVNEMGSAAPRSANPRG